MSKRYPYLSIPDADFSEELQGVLDKLNVLCEAIAIDPAKGKDLDEIHSAYWHFITLYIPSLLTEANKDTFTIPAEFKSFINYGFISEALCPQGSEVLNRLDTISHAKGHLYSVYYLDEWIKKAYERITRLDAKRRIEKDMEAAENNLKNYPIRMAECSARRNEFLTKYPNARKVMSISEEIDVLLPLYLELKKKIELSIRMTAQERIEYVQMTEKLSNLREARAIEQQAISTSVPQHELMRLDREVEAMMLEKREGELVLAEVRKAYFDDQEYRAGLSISMCRTKLKEEIRRIRTMGDLVSRRSRVKQCAILTDPARVPSPQSLMDCFDEILEIDQTVFLMSSANKKAFPSIVVLPSFGDGSYDSERHAFYVPIRSLKGLQQSLATALIEYHLDSQSGTRFRDSYLKLKKNQNINSSIQLRDNIVRDYIGWVTLEAKGYQVLDQEARGWFIEHVAPPMFALKHPHTLSVEDVPIGDIHAMLEEYEAREDKEENNFELMFKLGISYWRVRQYIKSSYMFMRATFLDAQAKDACYNAALSCFKTGQKAKAIEYWKHYLTIDKASFWTVRVQKFLTTVR
jgi:hypothetical protein